MDTNNYNVDIFVHTWWDESAVGNTFDFPSKLKYGRTGKWEQNSIEKIQSLYKPIKIVHEKQKQFTYHTDVSLEMQSPISLYSMTYSINQSNKLKSDYEVENNFVYDCVIRTRFDILLPVFSLDLQTLNMDKLYISGEIKPLLNDQFGMGNSAIMDYYSSLHDKIDDYYDEGYRDFVNEHFLRHHINKSKIPIYYCDNSEMRCSIITHI